LSGGW